MTVRRRICVGAIVCVTALAAGAVPAIAASSISVSAPRRIGVQQQFTMRVTGFADFGTPNPHPQAMAEVLVMGSRLGDQSNCANLLGTTGFINQKIPPGAFSFTIKAKFPQVHDNWRICAAVRPDFNSPQQVSVRIVPDAVGRIVVTQRRVELREKAINVSFSPPTVQATGTSLSVASILATEGFDGIPNASLSVQPDPDADAPRAVVCDTRAGGRLLWPKERFQDGTRSIGPFDTKADGGGSKQLKVLTGSQGGQFSLSGTLKGQATIFDRKELTLNTVGQGPFPADPRAFMTQLGHDYMEGSAPRFGAGIALRDATARTTLARQQAILEWLAFVQPPGLGFGPARRADGRAGVVLYPKGTPVRTPAGFITPGSPRFVIDVDALGTAVANSSTFGGIFRFPDLNQPQFADVVQPFSSWVGGGFAVAGFAQQLPNEDLAYFGYPEPPPVGQPGRNDFEGCLGLGIGGYLADVHSPARLVFKGAGNAQLGLGPTGALLDVPGGFVSAPRTGVARYHVPAGSYGLELTGTGTGRVTMVLSGPGAAQPSVFTFAARANAKGTVALTGRGAPRSLTFGGRRVVGQVGLGMRIVGLPRTLRAGRRQTLRLTVRNQFGQAVAGATVQAGSSTGATDGRGRAALSVRRPRGRTAVVVRAPGYRQARGSVRFV